MMSLLHFNLFLLCCLLLSCNKQQTALPAKSLPAHSLETRLKVKKIYLKVFTGVDSVKKHMITDKVDPESNNSILLEILDRKKKRLGFLREITTTTGCNSACLPVIYTSFYNAEGDFIKILSEVGLTKINHEPFTEEDYALLGLLLISNQANIKSIKDPKQMTDALSGETLPIYKNNVVAGAAYSTLRILKYHLETKRQVIEITKE